MSIILDRYIQLNADKKVTELQIMVCISISIDPLVLFHAQCKALILASLETMQLMFPLLISRHFYLIPGPGPVAISGRCFSPGLCFGFLLFGFRQGEGLGGCAPGRLGGSLGPGRARRGRLGTVIRPVALPGTGPGP